MKKVQKSLEKEHDVAGAREISIKLVFKPDTRLGKGNVSLAMSCAVKMPQRAFLSIANVEDGEIKIDTTTNDSRQPALTGMDGQEEADEDEPTPIAVGKKG